VGPNPNREKKYSQFCLFFLDLPDNFASLLGSASKKYKENTMDLGLKGKKAVITGGSKGIGRAIATLLVAEGADVAICARNGEEVDAAVAALNAAGGKAIGASVDVADKAALQSWIASAAEEMGGIDILVPNVSAGGGQMDENGWRANLEVDILGTTNAIEAATPSLQASGAGSIIIIGTTAAVEDFLGPQTYNAMKAALIVHAQGLAQVLAGSGIRVNCVSPGPIMIEGGAWDYIQNNLPDIYNSTLANQPSGRMGSAEEVANTVAFLASPAASWITGVNLVVDGGFTKRVQL
jgi:3-oxoacyl-[acyl-carrier protein] reductase